MACGCCYCFELIVRMDDIVFFVMNRSCNLLSKGDMREGRSED
jgi:hypothetical protein